MSSFAQGQNIANRAINAFFRDEGTAQSHADSLGITVEQFMLAVEARNQRLANAHAALAVSNAGSVQ